MDKESSTEEIEITPEMIEAGCDVIAGYNLKFESEEEWVEKIYRAMIKASRQDVLGGRS
jgi:phage head maturation protease